MISPDRLVQGQCYTGWPCWPWPLGARQAAARRQVAPRPAPPGAGTARSRNFARITGDARAWQARPSEKAPRQALPAPDPRRRRSHRLRTPIASSVPAAPTARTPPICPATGRPKCRSPDVPAWPPDPRSSPASAPRPRRQLRAGRVPGGGGWVWPPVLPGATGEPNVAGPVDKLLANARADDDRREPAAGRPPSRQAGHAHVDARDRSLRDRALARIRV